VSQRLLRRDRAAARCLPALESLARTVPRSPSGTGISLGLERFPGRFGDAFAAFLPTLLLGWRAIITRPATKQTMATALDKARLCLAKAGRWALGLEIPPTLPGRANEVIDP
jgi:hypothetical protein